jgi:hypothetical protein
MSERKKKRDEDLLEAGRVMGAVARTEPDIWEIIEKEAYVTGKKKHDVIAEMVTQAMIIREVVQKGLTMEQLLAAWELKDRIESMLFKKVMVLGTTFFGTLLTQVGELVAGISSYQREQMEKVVEEEKKRDIEFQMKKARAAMAAKLMEMMMPMITQVMSQTMKTASATQIVAQKQEKKPEVEVIE